MRTSCLIPTGALAAASLAAPQSITVDQAYAILTDAAEKTVATGRFTAAMSAVITEGGGNPVTYATSLDVGANTFQILVQVNGTLSQKIVGDGKRLWRYDPIRNEYAFMPQPADLRAAFGIASAWMRNESQRFIRLFSVGVRWMIKPVCTWDDVTGQLNMSQLTAGGNQWRGTMATFYIDPDPAKANLNSMSIDERLDIPKIGLRVVAMDVDVDYPPSPLPAPYTFSVPQGAKPALDLPGRGG